MDALVKSYHNISNCYVYEGHIVHAAVYLNHYNHKNYYQ